MNIIKTIPVLMLAACGSTQSSTSSGEINFNPANSSQFSVAVTQEVNKFRVSNGRAPLQDGAKEYRAADYAAQGMAKYNVFGHETPDPEIGTFKQRYRKAGLNRYKKAENVAVDWRSANGKLVTNADGSKSCKGPDFSNPQVAKNLATIFTNIWINSPKHRMNMLDGSFKLTGASIAVPTNPDDCGKLYAAQIFSRPR